MKKFAFFLPQFHEIKENNKWWGKGFTEWVKVKNATPLFNGHNQPKEPLDGYYNLLDKHTVEQQTKLMKDYQIDGLIYYHYYFKGKKLLQKPAENLLKWKDINQPFFFCWANHSWIKSWEGNSTILQEQTYGNELDWEKHFNYLLPFFKDDRYIKKNNKPLLMIFKTIFDEKENICNFFDKKCQENGFDGIYIINSCNNMEEYKTNTSKKSQYCVLNFLREPLFSLNAYRTIFIKVIYKIKKILFPKKIDIYNGNKILNASINKMIKHKNVIHGLFFEWDNTPRHKNRGYIITPINKHNFEKYMNCIKDEEFLFINAWNEWAEGMILEGTKENGYKYLEWIKDYSLKNKK